MAMQLKEVYVDEGSEKQINISSKQREATLGLLAEADFESDAPNEAKNPLLIFDAAKQECYTIMARDNFRRFIQQAVADTAPLIVSPAPRM